MSTSSHRPPDPWLDLGHLLEVIRQQRVTFLGFLGASLVAAGVGTALADREYEAVTVVHLLPRAGQEIAVREVVQSDAGGYMEGRERARTQVQIIQSRVVREEALRRYNQQGFDDLRPTSDDVDRLGRKLSAGPREDTQLVEIRVAHADPERAAALANLVAEVYQEGNLDARRDAARDTKVWIENRSDQYLQSVDQASAALLQFKEEQDVVDIEERIDGISSRLSALQQAYGDTTTERVLLETRLYEHQRLLRAGDTDVLAGMFDDPTLNALAEEHAQVVAQSAQVLARYGDQHPEHRRALAHQARVEEMLAAEVARAVDAERSRVNTLRRQETRLEEELSSVKGELLDKQRLQEEYSRLKMEHERARQVYDALGQRGTEVDLQAHTQLNDVRVVDLAQPPSRPTRPNVPLNMGMALFVGLGGGFGLALLRHRLDESIGTPGDVQGLLGETLLGAIPSLPGETRPEQRALYLLDHPRSVYAESFRALRGVLISTIGRGRSRRLLVTSTMEGEGKTTVAAGLAVAYAQLGLSVLLFEGDLRAPRVHQVLGLPPEPGVAEALADPRDPLRFVRPTAIPNLHAMTVGAGVDLPNELLASQAMDDVLDLLGETYKVVIIDTPPAGMLADAAAMASHTDGVLVVVRRGLPSRAIVAQTLARLRQTGARVLGVVLNDLPISREAKRYGLDRPYYGQRQEGAAPPAAAGPSTPSA
ncbi:polysaccharide biosynthesis tyrosine autokinase [Myxococcota bacterium]|nr:polysaccharide biosynthesis tyrosine autokinase [Myxococcota bacterium]